MLTRQAAVELVADISIELARAPIDVEAILVLATLRLSRIRPGTWVAVVMNPNPETSRIVVADDRDREMARYVEDYVIAIDRPQRVPTVGLSQKVIESGSPIVIRKLSFDELLMKLSPAGQAYCRTTRPPGEVRSVDLMIVPMRVGGATVGTLGLFDARDRDCVDERDVDWIQLVADRIALSVEHARLVGSALVRAGEMEMVHAISLANSQGRDPRLTLSVIVERITTLPDVDAADIMLLTEDGKELTVAASAGYRSPWPPEHRVDARWAALDRARSGPEINYYRADPERNVHHPLRSQFAREGFKTSISIALHASARAIGILNLYSRSVVEWDQQRHQFLDTLGDLVAMAVDESAPASPVAARPAARPDLNDLEVEILRFIAEGCTNREIAEKVYRSESTVKFHVRRILERTKVANRTELVCIAMREGWL